MSSTVTALYLRTVVALRPDNTAGPGEGTRRTPPLTEPGFEIAQSMGIALLGLVVAAAFATALEGLGVDVINGIRSELGL